MDGRAIPELEEWKSIKGFDGLYEISSNGCVIGLARTTASGQKKQTTKSRVIAQKTNGHGYMNVRLYKDGKQNMAYVHRLVLQAFVGEQPDGMNACHNDGNRSNNSISNLRWDTIIANHADKVKHGTLLNGERARHAKLTAESVLKIRELLANGVEQKDIANQFCLSQPTVSDIKTRRSWKHI